MGGRSIRIFLVDGTASGLRTAELGLSTIKAVVIPRASLSSAGERSELQKTGVYILVGDDTENPGQKKVYIGEGDTILTRLKAHNVDAEKDWWDEAVVFVSKDENLTKAHVRSLEAKLIRLAMSNKRCSVANGTNPTDSGWLPEADQVEMEEFVSQARLLLGTLGHTMFEAPTLVATVGSKRESEELCECVYSGRGFSATCIVVPDSGQFVVKGGSIARKEETPSLQQSYRTLRETLRQNGILVELDEQSYRFSQDYAFTSSTQAAQAVAGTTVNGRISWRLKDDSKKSYGEWEDERLARLPPGKPESE